MSTQTLRNSFGPWISVYPAFIKGTQSLEGGVLLSKLMNLWAQWGDGFYRTGSQLAESCCLSEREYKRAILAVKESKAFTIKRKGIPAVNHFYANADAIEQILLQHAPASRSPDFVPSSSDASVLTSSDDGVPTCWDDGVPTNKKEERRSNKEETPPVVPLKGDPCAEKPKITRARKPPQPVSANPPSLQEVRAYCREKGFKTDPSFFYKFFTESDWVDSNGKLVYSWKQKLFTWENMNQHRPPQRTESGDLPACGYTSWI